MRSQATRSYAILVCLINQKRVSTKQFCCERIVVEVFDYSTYKLRATCDLH